ncbi:hypothetical protein Tco_1202865 [Tanacetum coccineum]
MKMRSMKSKEKSKEKGVSSETTIIPTRGVIMKEVSETVTRPIVPPQQQLDPKDKGKGIMQEPEKPVKVKGKDQIAFDEEVAQRLDAQMQAEYKEEKGYSFVPMDSEVVEGSKSQAEGSEKRTRKELDEESVKRQKLEDDAEKAELKACLKIVPGDVVTIESLATKYLIIDWKTHILAEDMMYYQIIRADGSTKFYKIFSAMLDDFDRQNVLDLYRLRLYDSCGVHLLLMDTGITIHLMVEKKCPLTQEMLSKMLSGKLEVDHECEMAYELLRFTKSQYKNAVKVTADGYISTAGEVQRKYSKSLLLLVVKLILLVLVTTARSVSAVRV